MRPARQFGKAATVCSVVRQMTKTAEQSERNAPADALASIPADIVNVIGDARVTKIAIGRGGAWIGSLVRDFDPPLRVEDAITFAAAYTGGLRNIHMYFTNGTCGWFGADFRFRSFETATEVAARRAAIIAQRPKPKPHVRAKR